MHLRRLRPVEVVALGAPGCYLHAGADVPFVASIDAQGVATLTISVPTNPALYGLAVFAQGASSTSSNAFGFASSDAVLIRIR